jgi:uncharacterized protein (TIGR02147 family)
MTNSLYNHTDYKRYVNEWIENLPKKGFGEFRRMSHALGVSTTMISQVFRGDKHLSLELACDLCDHLGLDDDDTEYFLLLVDAARAGSHKLQKRLERQIKARQERAKKLENRVKNATELSSEAKAIFYSSWIYSGVRILTDLKEYNDAGSIAERLQLPRPQVQKVLDFLIQNGLVVAEKGRLQPGATRTHVGSSNHLVAKHHQNWRLLSMTKMIHSDEDSFHYTGPMTLSHEVALQIRTQLPEIVEGIVKQVIPSPGETVRCLNIDWFDL